tara:strand:+ start:18768 stop:19553 length:786 start_codon:yes stop_codon:yes gene_type:complete
MKRLIYQVYVGQSSNLYNWCTESVKAYADSINADYVLLTSPKLFIKPDPFTTNRSEGASRLGYLPIFEKENAFEYFPEYDQIAIIDSDIYIRENSPNVFDELDDHDFGGVYEREMPVTPQYANKIRNYSRMQYGSLDGQSGMDFDFNHPNGGAFMNMGMMVMNKSFSKQLNGMSPKEWITQPMFKAFVDGKGTWKWSTDQTLLNTFINMTGMKVKHLDYKFNALYTAIPNELLKDAHFIHFFLKDKLPDRGENVEELKKIV